MLGNKAVDCFLVQRCEYLDVALCVLVAHIQPELIESIGSGAVAVQPDVAFLGLAELLAVGLGYQGAGQCKGAVIATQLATNKFCTGGNVAPLVGTAHLQTAVLLLIEVQEVVTLQQLVCEFGKGHAILELTVQTALHAVLCHHVVNGDALAYLASEVQEGVVLHPVVVVHQFCLVGSIALEVKEACQLVLDAGYVMEQSLLVEQVALLALAAGIANHACSTAHESQRLVATTLEVAQHHHTAKVTDVQGVGSGVNTQICCLLSRCQHFFCAGHHLMEHSSPFQFFNKIHLIVL